MSKTDRGPLRPAVRLQPGDSVTGPAGCMRVRNSGRECGVCGVKPRILHVALRARGVACPEHCECCASATRAASVVPAGAVGALRGEC